MVNMPDRSITPEKVQALRKDLREYIASVARSFAKSIDDLYTRILAQIQGQFYDKATSDARFATKVHTHDAADIVSGTVTRPTNNATSQSTQFIGGSFSGTTGTFSGAVAGTTGTFNSGMTSTNVRNNTLSTNYAAVYVDGNGRLGISPSTASKKNITGYYAVDMAKWLSLPIRTYAYKDDPAQTTRIGFIADDLVAAGLTEFVQYDTDGNLQGLRIDQLLYGLMSAYTQSRASTLKRISNQAHQTVVIPVATTVAIGGNKSYPVAWPASFVDADYHVTASVYTSSGALVAGATAAVAPSAKTATGCTVQVSTSVALLATMSIVVEATHI